MQLRLQLVFQELFFLCLQHGEVLDVLATHGIFDHVELLVLRIQSISIVGLRFGMKDFDKIASFSFLGFQFAACQFINNSFLVLDSEDSTFKITCSCLPAIQCICTGFLPANRYHLHSRRMRSFHNIIKTELKEVLGVKCFILLERFPPGGIGVAWPLLTSKFSASHWFVVGFITFERVHVLCNLQTTHGASDVRSDCGMDTQRLSFPRTAVATRKATQRHSQSVKNVCAAQAQKQS